MSKVIEVGVLKLKKRNLPNIIPDKTIPAEKRTAAWWHNVKSRMKKSRDERERQREERKRPWR